MNPRPVSVIILTLVFAVSGCGTGLSTTVPPMLTQTISSIVVTQTLVTPQPSATSTLAVTNPPKPTATLIPAATLVPCVGNDADFVADVTIPDGTSIKPGAQFTKTWRLRNTGRCMWGAGYRLAYFDGPEMTAQGFVDLTQEVKPNETADISVVFTAPREAGAVKTRWQMQSPDGTRFGKKVFVQVYARSSPVDSILGVWQGNVAVFGDKEIEIRAECGGGPPCVVTRRHDYYNFFHPFNPKSSNEGKLCFFDLDQEYCFSLQPDGTLKFEGSGPEGVVSGTMYRASD